MDLDRLTPAESRRFWSGEWLAPLEEDEMDNQLSMLAGNTSMVPDTAPEKIARRTDPETSHVAARAVTYRTGTQKATLLALYREHPDGLTDEEVAGLAGMERHAATKRCSDLRNDGAIVAVGERKGRTGLPQRVCRVA